MQNCRLEPGEPHWPLAPLPPSWLTLGLTVKVRLDSTASASASERKSEGSKLQAAKNLWAPPGLGALVPDPVAIKVDVGDCTVGLQSICKCLSEKSRGRNCKLQTPRGHRLALAPSAPMKLNSRLTWVTVQLDFKASASTSDKKHGVEIASCEDPAGTAWPWRPRLRSCCH